MACLRGGVWGSAEAVTAFFVGLGFETEGRTFLEGEFLDTVVGIPDAGYHLVGGVGQHARMWRRARRLHRQLGTASQLISLTDPGGSQSGARRCVATTPA